jgi:hypothetical protein
MLSVRAYPMVMLVLFSSLDCITTIVGTTFFGAVEQNPLLSGLVNTNIVAFASLKTAVTILVCFSFIQTEKILMKTKNKETRAFSLTSLLLKGAYAGTIVFLFFVVANNILVLLQYL